MDTSFYALGFPSDEEFVKRSKLLRELNFGAHEGLHFDNLTDQEKMRFMDPEFRADGGESWSDVRARAIKHFKTFDSGSAHLVFTHGGLIASYLNYHFGEEMEQMPSNGSFVGVALREDGSGEPDHIDFSWQFPYIEEDI